MSGIYLYVTTRRGGNYPDADYVPAGCEPLLPPYPYRQEQEPPPRQRDSYFTQASQGHAITLGRRMTMNRIYGAAVMLGLVAWSAVSVEAAELNGPGDEVSNEIVVVNNSVTSVRVYVEDSEGVLHQLGRVSRGKVERFEAPADASERGDFRVRIHPLVDPDPWSDPVSRIKTRALNVADDDLVVVWLTTDLTQSEVEVRSK
jgi:hypothetical protein